MKASMSQPASFQGVPLYPTWFRWKRLNTSGHSCGNHLYIPHGSDESWVFPSEVRPYISTLYPTWFRWKPSFCACLRLPRKLYIPHGSDERLGYPSHQQNRHTLYPTWFRWKRCVCKNQLISLRTLYPTWFRWKGCSMMSILAYPTTFISHMVQMKVPRQYLALVVFHALYPTWFRWKLHLAVS